MALIFRPGAVLYPGRMLPESVTVQAADAWLVLIAVAAPTRAEVDAVTRGVIDLSIERDGPALVWILRCVGLTDWSAASMAWWERTGPELPSDHPGVGGLAAVVLCDTRTKIHATRAVGLTHRVAAAIRDLEAAAQATGRDDAARERVRAWTQTADGPALAARARAAAVVTGVPAKGAS